MDALGALVADQDLGKLGKALRKATKAVTAYDRKLDAKGVAKKVDADELEKTRDLMKREGLLKADVDVKKMIYAQ